MARGAETQEVLPRCGAGPVLGAVCWCGAPARELVGFAEAGGGVTDLDDIATRFFRISNFCSVVLGPYYSDYEPDALVLLVGDSVDLACVTRRLQARYPATPMLTLVPSDVPTADILSVLRVDLDDFARRETTDLSETIARITLLLHRCGKHEPQRAPANGILVDERLNVLHVGSEKIRLKPTSLRIFRYLHLREGRWVSAREIQEKVLRAHCSPGASNVRWHILQLRRALSAHAACIEGEPRSGYRFKR